MRIPQSILDVMDSFTDEYSQDQRSWFRRNRSKILKSIRYREGGKDTFSGYWTDTKTIDLFRHNYGVYCSDRFLASTIFHEYGHLLFDKGIFDSAKTAWYAEEEISEFVVKGDGEATAKLIHFATNYPPVMLTDAASMLCGRQLEGLACHKEGYGPENMMTEMYAEVFADMMTGYHDRAEFERLCPKTAKIIYRQIYHLFK